MRIVSRKEAKEEGLTRYFTGKPCPQGHVSERLVCNACCVKCVHLRNNKSKPPSFRAGIAKWKRDNPDKVKKSVRYSTIKKKYKITEDDWNKMFEAQGKTCAICGEVNSVGHWATDHCHESGKIRGILCSKCNVGIGIFKDDVWLLQSAIKYLRKHK